ncbi:hypothetical protein [Streptomyces albus]|nr:hypothetical protein [Streptomyces albus]
MVDYRGCGGDVWPYLPDVGGDLSSIVTDVADAWLPGVPNC